MLTYRRVTLSSPLTEKGEEDDDLTLAHGLFLSGMNSVILSLVFSFISSCLWSVLPLSDKGGSLKSKALLSLFLQTAACINHTDAENPKPWILTLFIVLLPSNVKDPPQWLALLHKSLLAPPILQEVQFYTWQKNIF